MTEQTMLHLNLMERLIKVTAHSIRKSWNICGSIPNCIKGQTKSFSGMRDFGLYKGGGVTWLYFFRVIYVIYVSQFYYDHPIESTFWDLEYSMKDTQYLNKNV